MSQNDWLSTYFGDDVAEDLEKTAQALMLTKLAEAAGLDLNQLSEEEIQALAAELMQELGAQQGHDPQAPQGMPGQGMMGQQPQGGAPQVPAHLMQAQQAQAASPEMMAKEAQAKFDEADALGRVMAHSYVDELEKIASAREVEKTAGRFGDAARSVGSRARSVGSRAKSMAQNASWKAKGHAENIGHHARTRAREVGDHIGRNKGVYGAGAGGVAAGVAAGRMSKKEKTASAFEKLANDRAFEILQTLGIDPTAQQEPEQTQDVDFGTAVDQRALQILADAGYDPTEVATAYDQAVGGEVPQQ